MPKIERAKRSSQTSMEKRTSSNERLDGWMKILNRFVDIHILLLLSHQSSLELNRNHSFPDVHQVKFERIGRGREGKEGKDGKKERKKTRRNYPSLDHCCSWAVNSN